MQPVPEFVARLLWDVDVGAIDLDRDHALIFEHVMTRGTWEAMQWLRRRYPRETVVGFLCSRAVRALSARDLAYWALVYDVPIEARRGGGRPDWAGP